MVEQSKTGLPNMSGTSSEDLPGKLLKETRENKKMTREEVAERLHLHTNVIKALESDNYAELPGKTYIQGYLRSYAGLLNIPYEDVAVINSQANDTNRLLPESVNYTAKTERKRQPYFLGSAILLFLLVIFSGLISVEKQGDSEKTTTRANVEEEKDKEESTLVVSDNIVADEELKKDEVLENDMVSTSKIIDKSELEEKFTGLILKYKKGSWTEVYDINGKKLVYGTIKPGEEIQVDGLQPYSVLFGDATAVTVEFQGKVYSHEKYIRNGMAQFVIGSSFNN